MLAVTPLRARAGRRRRRVQEEVLASIVVKVGHKHLQRIGHFDIVCAGISRRMCVGNLFAHPTSSSGAWRAPDATQVELVTKFVAAVKVAYIVDSGNSVVVLRSWHVREHAVLVHNNSAGRAIVPPLAVCLGAILNVLVCFRVVALHVVWIKRDIAPSFCGRVCMSVPPFAFIVVAQVVGILWFLNARQNVECCWVGGRRRHLGRCWRSRGRWRRIGGRRRGWGRRGWSG